LTGGLTEKLQSIFMPHALGRRDSVQKRNGRFVHYTSAVSALNIIRSKEIWMRNTTCMTDYSEVQHGGRMLEAFFADDANKKAYAAALDGCYDGLATEILNLFYGWWQDTVFQSYVTSISEHDDSEDLHGRLSMWRAFSRSSARVAFVLRIPLTEGSAEPLNLLFSPVAYFAEPQVHRVIKNIEANREVLQKIDRPAIVSVAFHMLLLAALCLKHEGFHEEREWRFVYAPKRRPSPLISSSIEVIDQVPQTVYKIPLRGPPPPCRILHGRQALGPAIRSPRRSRAPAWELRHLHQGEQDAGAWRYTKANKTRALAAVGVERAGQTLCGKHLA